MKKELSLFEGSMEMAVKKSNEMIEGKTMTTKELSEVLGVGQSSLKRVVQKLGSVLGEVKKNSQGGYLFNEEQATMIKKELQKHHNLESRQIDMVSTEQEENETILNALSILKRRADEYKARAEIAEQKVTEQQPKVEVYDQIVNSETCQDIRTVAQTIGIKNVFKKLVDDGIFEVKWTDDGQKYYKPYAKFGEYFVIKDGGFWVDKDGNTHTRPKAWVTGKGLTWLTKRYGL